MQHKPFFPQGVSVRGFVEAVIAVTNTENRSREEGPLLCEDWPRSFNKTLEMISRRNEKIFGIFGKYFALEKP